MPIGDTDWKRRRWVYLGIVGVLSLVILLLGPISSASVYLADRLVGAAGLNCVLAVLLVLAGFTSAHGYSRKASLLPVRRGLLSYICAAAGMAGMYYLIHVSHSGCYSFASDSNPAVSILDFMYFSFVTVTTLGYVDILPNHTFGRAGSGRVGGE